MALFSFQADLMHTSISSPENSHVKQAIHLRERHWRNKTGLFLIEGYRELMRAHQAGVVIEQLFCCPELYLGTNEQSLIDSIEASGARILDCTEALFRKMSYRDRPDGLIAICKQYCHDLEFLSQKLKTIPCPLIVVAEAIEKPGNLGTILRSSDAAGAHGVIICNRCTDIFNPNVIRASTGILFCLPVVHSSSEEAISWLKKHGIMVLAARPQAEKLYTQIDMKRPLACVVGTEQLGLSEIWQNECDTQVRIPMCGAADSLNVAQATTLLLYEALRQRSG